MQLQELRGEPLLAATPAGFSLDQVVVRQRPDEQLMDQHHYLGFKRFAGRGLRYVAEWGGRWIAGRLARQRSRCATRSLDRMAREEDVQAPASDQPCRARGTCGMMSAMLRRLSDDWQEQYGHPLLVVESFVDPARFSGTMYEAANWSYVATARAMRAATVTTPTRTASPSGCTCARCATTRARSCGSVESWLLAGAGAGGGRRRS